MMTDTCRNGGIGRHKGLKIPRTLYVRASSILVSGITAGCSEIRYVVPAARFL